MHAQDLHQVLHGRKCPFYKNSGFNGPWLVLAGAVEPLNLPTISFAVSSLRFLETAKACLLLLAFMLPLWVYKLFRLVSYIGQRLPAVH